MKKETAEITETFDLNLHMHRLLMREPFFAGISRRINKIASKSLPTAGVWINPDTAQFELLYNPDFFLPLTEIQRLGVVKHELYHLIFEHVTGRKPVNPVDPRKPTKEEARLLKIWNYAADLAINSHISEELPEFCCVPGVPGTPFEDLPKGESAEWYYKKLIKKLEKQEEDGDGGEGQPGGKGDPSDAFGDGQFDDHGKWDEAKLGEDGDAIAEIAKERIKDHMRKAAQEAGESGGWGTISAETRKDILDRITSKLDWRKVLRYFVKTSQRSHKRSTVRRVNKRYAYIHPGKRVTRTAKILVAIDQSGSVYDALLALFFCELAKLSEIAEFTVLFFDTSCDEQNMFVWKKGQRVKPFRTRCGGTDFNAPTEYVNKHGGFDGVMILTDLEAPKPKPCKVQRLWIAGETHASRPYFQPVGERIVSIPDKDIAGAGW